MVLCLFITYCNSLQASDSSSEVGKYCSLENESETLTISDDMEFNIEMEELSCSGTYYTAACCWEDYLLILMLDNGESIIATYSYTKIGLTYSGRTIYFYKK